MDREAGADVELQGRSGIAARLRSDIESGVYLPGAKLPSYRQLAADLGAASNTVGEAVRLLAREGLVTIRPQSGAVVNDPTDRPTDTAEQLRTARADLMSVQGELRAVRRTVGELEDQVANLIGRLSAE